MSEDDSRTRPTPRQQGRSISYLIARLQRKLRLVAKNNCDIHNTSKVEAGSQVIDSTIGRHSFCGYDCIVVNAEIGSFCSIANGVVIGGSAHPKEFVSTSPVFLSHRDSVTAKFSRHEYYHLPRTTIGHDVWIGFGAYIRSGTTIGTGAIVGMGAVVTRDVAPYDIVAGNPAKVISHRFEEKIANGLLKSEWWNLDDTELTRDAAYFTNPENYLKHKGLI